MKQIAKLGAGFAVIVISVVASAQQAQISRDGGGWNEVLNGQLSGVKNLRVKLDAGSVVVRGGSQPGIDYTLRMHSRAGSEEEAKRDFQSYRISSFVKGDTAWLVGEWNGHSLKVGGARISIVTGGHRFGGEMVINLPREMDSVRVETEGGSADAAGILGRVSIQSGGGKIRVNDVGGDVDAETGGDAVEIGNVGGNLKLETGGGNISIGNVKGSIHAETGGGNVVVISGGQEATLHSGGGNVAIQHCVGEVKASTGGGSINLGDVGGAAEIETGGGDIHLTSAKGRVSANTGAGSIELYGVPSGRVETGAGGITVKFVNTGAARSDSRIETSTGDITIYIAPDVALSVRASVDLGNGHHITSEVPGIRVASEGDQWGPRRLHAEGDLNGGGPVLKVRTTNGDVKFKVANH